MCPEQVGHRRLWARARCTYLMAPTLRAHGITIPNRLGKCLARAVAGSLDIVPWHALYVSAMQEFLSTIDRQRTVTLLHNRTRSRLRFDQDRRCSPCPDGDHGLVLVEDGQKFAQLATQPLNHPVPPRRRPLRSVIKRARPLTVIRRAANIL
jgi:hypothetical protein